VYAAGAINSDVSELKAVAPIPGADDAPIGAERAE
jgi:hypothetical protein